MSYHHHQNHLHGNHHQHHHHYHYLAKKKQNYPKHCLQVGALHGHLLLALNTAFEVLGCAVKILTECFTSPPPCKLLTLLFPCSSNPENYNKISIIVHLAFYCRFLLMRSWSLLSSRRLWWQTSLSTRMTPRVKCWNFQMMIWRSPLSLGSVAQCCHAFLRS